MSYRPEDLVYFRYDDHFNGPYIAGPVEARWIAERVDVIHRAEFLEQLLEWGAAVDPDDDVEYTIVSLEFIEGEIRHLGNQLARMRDGLPLPITERSDR